MDSQIFTPHTLKAYVQYDEISHCIKTNLQHTYSSVLGTGYCLYLIFMATLKAFFLLLSPLRDMFTFQDCSFSSPLQFPRWDERRGERCFITPPWVQNCKGPFRLQHLNWQNIQPILLPLIFVFSNGIFVT